MADDFADILEAINTTKKKPTSVHDVNATKLNLDKDNFADILKVINTPTSDTGDIDYTSKQFMGAPTDPINSKYIQAAEGVFGSFADIPTSFVKGLSWEYIPSAETPEEAGLIHKTLTGASHLTGLGLGLIGPTKLASAFGWLVKGAGVARAGLRGAQIGGMYGFLRRPNMELGESRLSNTKNDAIMFGMFMASGGALQTIAGKINPLIAETMAKVAIKAPLTETEKKIFKAYQYGQSMALGGGAGALEPADSVGERVSNVLVGIGTFGIAHGMTEGLMNQTIKLSKGNIIRRNLAKEALAKDDTPLANKYLDEIQNTQPEVMQEVSARLKETLTKQVEAQEAVQKKQDIIDKTMPKELDATLKLKSQARQVAIDKEIPPTKETVKRLQKEKSDAAQEADSKEHLATVLTKIKSEKKRDEARSRRKIVDRRQAQVYMEGVDKRKVDRRTETAKIIEKTKELKPTDKVGNDTLDGVIKKLLVGDRSVLPDIEKGVKEYSAVTMQHNIGNQITKVAFEKIQKEGLEYSEAYKDFNTIKDDVAKIIRKQKVKEPEAKQSVVKKKVDVDIDKILKEPEVKEEPKKPKKELDTTPANQEEIDTLNYAAKKESITTEDLIWLKENRNKFRGDDVKLVNKLIDQTEIKNIVSIEPRDELLKELDKLDTEKLASRAKELELDATIVSKVKADPEFVKRRIIEKTLNPNVGKIEEKRTYKNAFDAYTQQIENLRKSANYNKDNGPGRWIDKKIAEIYNKIDSIEENIVTKKELENKLRAEDKAKTLAIKDKEETDAALAKMGIKEPKFARDKYSKIMEKDILTRSDRKWLSDNKEALKLTPKELKEVRSKMVSNLQEGYKPIISEERYIENKDIIGKWFKSRPIGSIGGQFEGSGKLTKALVDNAVYHAERGITNFAQWGNRMVKQYGEKIRPYLHKSWVQAKDIIQEYKNIEGQPGSILIVDQKNYDKSLSNLKKYFKGEKPYKIEYLGSGPSLHPEVLKDVITITKYHIAKGVKGFYPVSQKVIKEYGEKVRPYLHDAFKMANESIKLSQGDYNIPRSKTSKVAAKLGLNEPNPDMNEIGTKFSAPVDTQMIASRFADYALGSISTRLKNLHPEIMNRSRKWAMDLGLNTAKDVESSAEIVKGINGMPEQSQLILNYFLINSRFKETRAMMKDYNVNLKAFDSALKVKEGIWERYKSSGGKQAKDVEDHWPRLVRDYDGLMRSLGVKAKSQIDEAISNIEKSTGEILSTEEKGAVVDKLLRGFSQGKLTLSDPKYAKARTIYRYSPAMVKYLAPPHEALISYIHNMNNIIEARRFFGKKSLDEVRANKALKKMGIDMDSMHVGEGDLQKSIGEVIIDIKSKGLIESPADIATLKSILHSIFKPGRVSNWVSGAEALTYATTLTNIGSTMVQIQDMALSAQSADVFRAVKHAGRSLAGKSNVTLENLGFNDIHKEIEMSGPISYTVSNIMRVLGFTKVERTTSEAAINGTFEKYRSLAKSHRKTMYKELRREFGYSDKDANNTMEELKAWKKGDPLTDNVRLLLFSVLSDIKPMSILEMPQGHADARGSQSPFRLAYTLKRYQLKLFDIYRRKIFQEIKHGDRVEGIKRLVRLTTTLAMLYVGVNALKDFWYGREFDFNDTAVNSIWSIIGLTRYTPEQIKKEGLAGALAQILMPATVSVGSGILFDLGPLYDNLMDENEIDKGYASPRYMGELGKQYYYRFGEGKRREERRLEREFEE